MARAPIKAQTRSSQHWRWINLGLWLSLTLGGAIVTLGFVLVGHAGEKQGQDPVNTQREALATATPAPSFDASAIPGFRKRGTVFVGEVQGGNGTVLRLVFDAKSNALIGMHVVSQKADKGQETTSAQPARDCTAASMRDSALPPLPLGASLAKE